MSIVLTSAELELIQAKREAAAAEEKLKEANLAEDNERRKVQALSNIDKYTAEDDKHIAAAQEYYKSFPSAEWKLDIKVSEHKYNVYVYDINGNYTMSEIPYTRRTPVIIDNTGKYRVRIGEAFTGSRYSRRSKGYCMYVSGPKIEYRYESKALSKATTVISKVNECKETIQSEIDYKNRLLNSVDVTVNKFKELYPDASIVAGKGWQSSGNRNYGGFEYDKVTVTLANGIIVEFRVYADGSISRQNITFGIKDQWELMNKLNAINN